MELRGALASGHLTLEFQPERRIAGALGQAGSIRSVEALVRWRHPTRGLVPPGAFLPLAEGSALIARIGLWILRQAAADARAWQLSAPAFRALSVGVNLSASELARPGLAGAVAGVLRSTGLPAETLTLEVTEGAVCRDLASSGRTLRTLRRAGVRVCLDDCGITPDTIGLLSTLPLDAIKIDGRIVRSLGSPKADDAGLRALLQAARRLGLETVGKGVETRSQLTALRTLGCDLAQGYLFGKPLGAPGITSLLRAERRRGGAGGRKAG